MKMKIKYKWQECPTGTTAWCVPGRPLSFDRKIPANTFCKRPACLFTILRQVTADPQNCVREIGGRT
jgi:hypothetical protein